MGLLSKWFERGFFAFVVVFLLFLGLVQGVQVQSFTLDLFFVVIELALLDAVSSSLGFAAFLAFSAVLFSYNLWSSSDEENIDYNPKVEAVIPNHYDGEVVGRLIESLSEVDYSNLEITLVCTEGDEKSLEVAESFSDISGFKCLISDKQCSSKSEKINYAVRKSEADAIAIFDADQIAPADFFEKAVKNLKSNEVVQVRHLPFGDNLWSQMAYYESVVFVYMTRQVSYLLTSFRLAGSNSVLMEKEVFDKIGGYDPEMVTEDFDFAHRCFKNGVGVVNILEPSVSTQAANSFTDWWGQRKRWMKGYFQVLQKLIYKLFTDFKGYRSIISLAIAIGSLLGSFLMLILVSKFLLLLIVEAFIYLLPLAIIMIISLLSRIYDYKKEELDNIGYGWLLTPLMFPLFSVATIKAFTESVIRREVEWYRVEK